KYAPSPFPPVFPDAQIGIKPFGNVYLTGGMNNIYSGEINVTPQIPCISVSKLTPDIHPVPLPVHISATKNYWGSWTVTDNFFALTRDYIIDAISDYATEPYFEGLPQHSYSSNEPPSPESTQLYNALMLEEKENYKACIIQYEHVIKKYVDSPEYYAALARLPYVYLKAGLETEPLINTYDEGLLSVNTTQKKFFREMKIATHIKGKRYDTAIALAEEMKAEAQSEEEIILCDIDIAICNMMLEAENEGKGRTSSGSLAVNELIGKLTGNEVKSEPASITENILPSEFNLYQNYPNPFNPVTQIKFDLTKTSKIKLSIYNINGQIVAELANGVKNAGYHVVDFDGSKLNSGVYYYTLCVDGKNITKKMILTK
ncbi:MAG: T9SS type A sorting domain-containing protein, partial [Candidatus Delongbacteria bacterium]|nr:T9SS type A sorting domain-containing protein [Candidatus Delongbacteria bacterium]MCG2761203.1 T9SS type A sorting domain-containing protein [Candidatus Delongbacteria bacterium]